MDDSPRIVSLVLGYVLGFGAPAIIVSLYTPIPTWLKLRAVGGWLIVIWLLVLVEELTGPTLVSCAGPASIVMLPIGIVTLWVAKPDQVLRPRPLRGRETQP